MMKIGVCEDDQADLEMICHYIEQFAKLKQYELEIISNPSGKEFWNNYHFQKYNLLFLDIYLEDTTGIAIAKKLRELGDTCGLVFMTTSKDYAIEGFELRALHYLIKPITRDLVFKAMTSCESVLKRDMKYLSVHSGKLMQRIYFKDIIYIEVFNKVSLIHTVAEVIKTYTSLSQLEKQLGGDPFLRCHRCSIINMLYVETFTADDFIMTDGATVAIRKIGSVDIRQYYLDFVFERIRGDDGGS